MLRNKKKLKIILCDCTIYNLKQTFIICQCTHTGKIYAYFAVDAYKLLY